VRRDCIAIEFVWQTINSVLVIPVLVGCCLAATPGAHTVGDEGAEQYAKSAEQTPIRTGAQELDQRSSSARVVEQLPRQCNRCSARSAHRSDFLRMMLEDRGREQSEKFPANQQNTAPGGCTLRVMRARTEIHIVLRDDELEAMPTTSASSWSDVRSRYFESRRPRRRVLVVFRNAIENTSGARRRRLLTAAYAFQATQWVTATKNSRGFLKVPMAPPRGCRALRRSENPPWTNSSKRNASSRAGACRRPSHRRSRPGEVTAVAEPDIEGTLTIGRSRTTASGLLPNAAGRTRSG
jgi:hypothetical protein